MFGYIILIALNVTLYLGTIQGMVNALNLAEFLMWVTALLYLAIMFTPEQDIANEPERNFFAKWAAWLAAIITVCHCAAWGFVAAPALISFSYITLLARRYAIKNK